MPESLIGPRRNEVSVGDELEGRNSEQVMVRINHARKWPVN